MATRKLVSKHISASSSTYVGRDGELVLDTVNNTLKVSDGSTPGGVTLNTDSTYTPGSSQQSVTVNGTGPSNATAVTLTGTDAHIVLLVTSSVPTGPSNATLQLGAGAFQGQTLTVLHKATNIAGSSISVYNISGGNSVQFVVGNAIHCVYADSEWHFSGNYSRY
jgi:hypothetical protein